MGTVEQVIEKFNAADSTIKETFPKTDPRLVVELIFDRNANAKNIYILEVMLKPGHNTDKVRQDVINKSGSAPGFYLQGTKMIVSHMLDLEFLKWINEQDGIVGIKGSRYGAGGATNF